jgi:hypothetical protein
MDGIKLPAPLLPPSVPSNPLGSASGWARDDIAKSIGLGLVPENLRDRYLDAITRAEFCALAVALYETEKGEITQRKTFADTDDVNVEKMGALGVVLGVGGDDFAPDRTLTREQAAVILVRLSNVMDQPLPLVAPTFADNEQIASWAIEAVGQMQFAGIMGGIGSNTFSPKDNYTREQSITTVLRTHNIVTGETPLPELPSEPHSPPPNGGVPTEESVYAEIKTHAEAFGYTVGSLQYRDPIHLEGAGRVEMSNTRYHLVIHFGISFLTNPAGTVRFSYSVFDDGNGGVRVAYGNNTTTMSIMKNIISKYAQ